MRTTLRSFLPVALLLFLLPACGGGTTQMTPEDSVADVLDDAALPDLRADESEEPADVEPLPDLPAPDLGPQPGDPCEDGNPCTFGETLLEDLTCPPGSPYTCDDGRECTDDLCNGLGDCLFQVTEGACLIDGACAAADDVAPGGCGTCQPTEDLFAWVPVADGEPCDDGDACTGDDACADGLCVGEAVSCDDENPCTADQCDPQLGCQFTPLSAVPCGTAGPCSTEGVCMDGACEGGGPLSCEDGNPCTADSCDDEEGCQHEALDGVPCDDGDLCTEGDLCVGETCEPGPELLDCNDYNECTADLCHPVSGCYHELNDNPCCNDEGVNVCDDGNICTTDSCDPDTGECFYENNSFKCNDGNPCTGPDACSQGACSGPVKDCDDGNPCTQDSCDPVEGCLNAPLDGIPCDDGLECSTGDACVAGKCEADLTGCACQPEFSPHVSKLSALAIGKDGKPGNGLDVDLHANTCSPAANCSDGVDNSLSLLSGFANEALADAVASGAVILLLEHRGFAVGGDPYVLAVYIGQSAENDCDIQAETCDYYVLAESFDDACDPIVVMDNAKVVGTQLSAGGPGYNFTFPLPLAEGVLLEVVLFHAQIQAKVTVAGGGPASLSGVLGGAISKQDMLDAIDAVPEDQLPLSKDMILSMIDMMVTNDIDSDGDGVNDAASIGLPFAAIGGKIVGTVE